jgi:hypothetical protein
MRAFISILALLSMTFGVMASQGADVSFQVLDRGSNSGEKEQGIKVLRTERAFEEFLKEHSPNKADQLPKQVDWKTEQVVLVFGGEFNTGGYGVNVKRILSTDVQRLTVEAVITKPSPGQGVTLALTTPYTIIKMPRQVAAIKIKFLQD